MRDPAVKGTPTKWDFWLVGNDLDGEGLHDLIHQRNLPPGNAMAGENYDIWIFRWSEVMDSCRRRLQFMRDLLDQRPSDEEAIAYLHRTHERLLPPTV